LRGGEARLDALEKERGRGRHAEGGGSAGKEGWSMERAGGRRSNGMEIGMHRAGCRNGKGENFAYRTGRAIGTGIAGDGRVD